MTIESPATYINQLNANYPEGGADRSTADDHLRLIKETVKATFPAITGPVTVTHAELNLVAGATKTLASVSALTVKYSLSISALTTSLNSVSVVVTASLRSVSAVVQASLSSVSAALQTNINAVSNTVSIISVRVNTLSISVSVVQAALVAFPATERTWSAQQIASSGSLTDSVSIAWDCDADGQIVRVTLADNRTMEAPSNVSENAMYVLKCIQDAVGGRTLTWNAAYKFPQGLTSNLSTAANAVDFFSFIGGAGNTMYCVGLARGFS